MENYGITIITSIMSFFGAYIASTLALRNQKQKKYFAEKRRIYFNLAIILPDVESFLAQSEYLDGNEGHCGAEEKLPIMKIQLDDAERRYEILQKKAQVTEERRYEVQTEITNLKYKIEKHKEYLEQMKELLNKIKDFEMTGNKNLLRIFASGPVWESYIRFRIALENEYYCNIGVKKEDLTHHIINLIFYMRKDLSGKSK